MVVSAPIPCRGAKAVIFFVRGTDANIPAALGFNVTSDPAGAGSFLQAGPGNNNSFNAIRHLTNMPMNAAGGMFAMVTHLDGIVPSYGICLTITGHATNAHTAVVIDALVVYDGDVMDLATSFGQLVLSTTPSETVYPA